MKKTHIAETRVLISVCYEGLENDNDLLDAVNDIDEFKPVEQQMYGFGCLPYGFVIFQGDKYPNPDQLKKMQAEVLRAGRTFRNNWKGILS